MDKGKSADAQQQKESKRRPVLRLPSQPPWRTPAKPPQNVEVQKEAEEKAEGQQTNSNLEAPPAPPAVANSSLVDQPEQISRKKLIEHMDLLSDGSDVDMDLESDHENPQPEIPPIQEPTPPPPEPAPACLETAETIRYDDGGMGGVDGQAGVLSTPPAEPLYYMEEAASTQLHEELVKLSQMLSLNKRGQRRREQVVEHVREAVRKVWPNEYVEVQAFGSFANGLGTWNSDIDLVLVGVAKPDADHGGYGRISKPPVNRMLARVLRQIKEDRLIKLKHELHIRKARIPIIKCTTNDDIEVDISICDDHGPRAAHFLKEQTGVWAPLRPLVLALKALIKSRSLNEVMTGGMGTYALANMVVAHLMDCSIKEVLPSDYGALFLSFLKRFGRDFDVESQAVSISRGGICDKGLVVCNGVVDARNYVDNGRSFHGGVPSWKRLVVEDYFTGRDISSGTFRIDSVCKLFSSTYMRLIDHLDAPPQPPGGPPFPILSLVFDAEREVDPHSKQPKAPDVRPGNKRRREALEVDEVENTERHGKLRRSERLKDRAGDRSERKSIDRREGGEAVNPLGGGMRALFRDLASTTRSEYVDRVRAILKEPFVGTQNT